jgi:hypothetical protein
MNKSSLLKGYVFSNPIAAWFLWVIVNTVGAAVAVGIISLARSIPGIDEDKALPYIAIPAFGLLISIAQFMLLSTYIPRNGWWILASLAGWSLGFPTILFIGRFVSFAAMQGTETTLVIIGTCLGVAQWFILRPHLAAAPWWIPANILGWWLLGLLVGRAFTSLIQLTLIGAIPALLTGAALVFILGYPSARGTPSANSDV